MSSQGERPAEWPLQRDGTIPHYFEPSGPERKEVGQNEVLGQEPWSQEEEEEAQWVLFGCAHLLVLAAADLMQNLPPLEQIDLYQ